MMVGAQLDAGNCNTMNNRDRTLGMNRDISRRDFMNGVAMVAGSLVLPGGVAGDQL
jgi:hypothetical protein